MRAITDSSADGSYQFVLAEDAPYLKNLAALWATDAVLAAGLESLDAQPSFPVELAKSGEPTVRVPTADGRQVYLHSRHNPVEEANRLVSRTLSEEQLLFYVFGFGLGYHTEEIFDRTSEDAVFCVFEPNLLLLRTALETRDLSRLIQSRRVHFFCQLDKSELFTRLMPYTPQVTLGSTEILHAASLQLNEEFHTQMQAWLAEFASFGRTNLNTLVLNGKRTLENIARNLGWYVASNSIAALKNRYQGYPAIIVSAGPSLRKNKHLLKQLVGRAVIIAVQTTLQPLLEMGIEPDFVTALDYHDICTRFFEKLPRTLKTHLVAEPKATNLIFSMSPGPLTILGNEVADALIREVKIKKDRLRAGSTVAHLAYYLAEHLGCDPIIFVGQDLGFSDGLYYAPGTSYEDVWRPEFGRFCTIEMKQWEQIVRERPIMRRIPDQQGRPMYTEERLFSYLHQFERDFSKSTAKIIDATEGGAAKRGTIVMPLAQAIAEHCQAALPEFENTAHALQWQRSSECIESLAARREEGLEIQRISRDTLPLLAQIAEHIEDQKQVNKLIAEIDLLRTKMNEHGRTYDLVIQMTQASEMQRFKRDRTISAAKLSGTVLQRRQVERDIENVKAVELAAMEFQALMDEVIEKLTHESTTPAGGAA